MAEKPAPRLTDLSARTAPGQILAEHTRRPVQRRVFHILADPEALAQWQTNLARLRQRDTQPKS